MLQYWIIWSKKVQDITLLSIGNCTIVCFMVNYCIYCTIIYHSITVGLQILPWQPPYNFIEYQSKCYGILTNTTIVLQYVLPYFGEQHGRYYGTLVGTVVVLWHVPSKYHGIPQSIVCTTLPIEVPQYLPQYSPMYSGTMVCTSMPQ